MDFYLDESGTTGDLISKKFDLDFFRQPIFTHACVSCEDEKKVNKFISQLKIEHEIHEEELKSECLYFDKPQAILEIVKYLNKNNMIYLCEIMDKKYDIAVSIVNHLIAPTLDNPEPEKFSKIRMDIYDYVAIKAPDECYFKFRELCLNQSEDTLRGMFDSLRNFFNNQKPKFFNISLINKNLKEKKLEYKKLNKIYKDECLKFFHPIPDFDKSKNENKILPNVLSFYNLLLRLNKYHLGELSEAKLHHDIQIEYSTTLQYCIANIRKQDFSDREETPYINPHITEEPYLTFIDSKNSIGIQLADILAGFLNRYINGVCYKQIDVDPIYNDIFNRMLKFNKINPPSCLGLNFVLPASIRNQLLYNFGV